MILICYHQTLSSGTDDIATACSICRENPQTIVPDVYKPQGFVDCVSGFPTLNDTVFCGGPYCPMCPSTTTTQSAPNKLQIDSDRSGISRSSAFSEHDNIIGLLIVVGIASGLMVTFFVIVMLYMYTQLQQSNQMLVSSSHKNK